MKRIKWAKAFSVADTLLLGLSGIALLLERRFGLKNCCMAIGFVFLFTGLCKTFSYFSEDLYGLAFQFDLAVGILSGITGILMIARTEYILSFLQFILGAFVLVDGGSKMQIALDARRFGLRQWRIMVAAAALCTAAGLTLMLFFTRLDGVLLTLAGCSLLADALLNLFGVLYTVRVPANKA